jgi:D-serine deaminase-like pyridoxal phosphate-dependent protein
VQWLIDTPERLRQYSEFAEARDIKLRANFEIDVGLHRGGFADRDALAAVLRDAKPSRAIAVSGLMGYDPHVPKMSDPDQAYLDAQQKYRTAIETLRAVLGVDPAILTLNGAGSPTYTRHAHGTVANEVSVGSAFVKPVDFDLPELGRHVPAAFIATPVIKALDRMRLPGHEWLSGPLNFIDPNSKRAFFIYGGHWLATPVSPPGLEYSSLFGRSSNQELLTGSDKVTLRPDDHVFFRPNQSEAVFLQFGDIALFDGETIKGFWPTFPVSA